jgi:hypothetical protein
VKIARLHVEEMATPVVALACDGAYYDVAALEDAWGLARDHGLDFHSRVLAARCAGLFELDARLRSGPRPRDARLDAASFLPLAPCDGDRAAYLQLAPWDLRDAEPRWQHRDARALVGDAQPVPCGAAVLEAGIALVVAEELWRATPREAERAVLGVTLLLDWGSSAAQWSAPGAPLPPTQLGAELHVGTTPRQLAALSLKLGAVSAPLAAAPFDAAEVLAYLSQHVRLLPGDVVGLGAMLRAEPGFGAHVTAELAPLLRLGGWATPAPAPLPWRRS